MSDASEAFSAVDRIESGEWDRFLVRLLAAIRARQKTDEYKTHIIAGSDA